MKNFMPKPYKKDIISVRVDVDKLEQIDKLLPVYNLNRSQFINRCIDYALSNMPAPDKNEKNLKF